MQAIGDDEGSKGLDISELAMMLESIGRDKVTHAEFTGAAEASKSLKLEDEHRLVLYGLYKQATIGDVNTSQPWAINIVERAKWNSWKGFEGFPKESAAAAYVYLVSQMQSDAGTKLLGVGEGGAAESNFGSMGATVSTLANTTSAEDSQWAESEILFKAVVEDNLIAVQEIVGNGNDINIKNGEGLTPLHFACDRGYLAIARYLIEQGADVTAVDDDGQTPLNFAEICEHEDLIKYFASLNRAK